jgi:transposase
MVAAGWSDPDLARQVLAMLRSWFDVLAEVAREAEARFGPLGPLAADDLAGLIGLAFLGGESVILLGDADWGRQVRAWLRSVGRLIREREASETGREPRLTDR